MVLIKFMKDPHQYQHFIIYVDQLIMKNMIIISYLAQAGLGYFWDYFQKAKQKLH